MSLPKQTKEIFDLLRQGNFISANSCSREKQRLFEIITEAYDPLRKYFSEIGLNLENKAHYFYFSRVEENVDLDRKIEAAYKWVDIVDFFKSYDPAFAPGYRFSPSRIAEQCKVDVALKAKLDGMKKYAEGGNFPERIRRLVKELDTHTFVEEEDPQEETYKVLNSFEYLENLILRIDISADTINEIPQ